MGLLQKIKSKLGIGGVKIQLDVPAQYSTEACMATGKFTLTTKSDQDVKTMEVKLIEKRTTGRGDDAKTKEYTLGSQKFNNEFAIKTGENKTFDFEFPFEVKQSMNDKLKEKGGAMGAIGSLGKFAKGEKSEYVIDVSVDVKAAALDPTEEQEVKLV
jgi:hypothetical protein